MAGVVWLLPEMQPEVLQEERSHLTTLSLPSDLLPPPVG